MRFAVSAMAAVSGVVLLGLALYGQPAVYLHQAREEWAALVGGAATEQLGDQRSEFGRDDAVANHVTQLQQEVAQLKQELTAVPAPVEPPSLVPVQPAREAGRAEPPATRFVPPSADPATTTTAPFERPEAVAPEPAPRPLNVEPRASEQLTADLGTSRSPAPEVALPELPKAESAKPVPGAATPTKPETARLEQPKTDPLKSAPRPNEPSSAAAAKRPPVKVEPPRSMAVVTEAPPPERLEVDPFNVDVGKADTPRAQSARPDAATTPPSSNESVIPEPLKTELGRRDLPRPEPVKPDPARSTQQKVASVKAAPPPPVSLPPPPRRETEDAQSVLARLRQLGPASPRQAGPPPAEARPGPLASPLLPRLAAARAALADGRVEDARRLLQETQLQLVFRPIEATGDDSPRAGKSAADVAHSLEALSANNIPLSRRYIDRAADDLSDRGGGTPVQEPDMRTTGYAPAYPQR